jgi:hypothetical protein
MVPGIFRFAKEDGGFEAVVERVRRIRTQHSKKSFVPLKRGSAGLADLVKIPK